MKTKQEKSQVIFLVVIAVLALLVFSFLQFQETVSQNILWIVLVAGFILLVWKFDFLLMLEEYQRAVISRFGKINRVGGPGWALKIPIIESYVKVDLRAQVLDIPIQEIVTKDGIEVKIDAVIYLRVRPDEQSVINSVVRIEDYKEASKLYVISLIREISGSLTMDELISGVGGLNEKLGNKLDEVSKEWGIDCESVEIKDVQIPRTVLDAMHEEKAAVQRKLGRMEEALAHKAEIDAVKEAAEQLSDKALSYYYIRALERMSEGKATKIVFPMEISKPAESLAGKVAGSEKLDSEKLFQQYGPMIAAYLKEEKQRRDKEKKGKDESKDES